MKNKPKIELLAPAGNMECFKTALYFGADAIYISGKKFGLRAFADNFSDEEIRKAAKTAHGAGKRIFVTVNAIFAPGEIEQIGSYLAFLKEAEADAVIVSDPGVLCLAKEAGLEVHLSTQASTLNHLSAGFWHKNGVKRIVLAREASLEDIAFIRKNTPETLELEAFVHGAMCVAYSGRCLLSSVFTGRSGNRGECAQPCRWKYTIHEAGYPEDYFPIMEDERGTYILNSKDHMMIEHIREMAEAGICSFKIEGRMKSAYYVATAVNAYRKAIDAYLRYPSASVDEGLVNELKMSGSRRFTTGFFFGRDPGMQDIKKELADRSLSFCALVLSKRDERGRLLIEQRNRFFEGEELHVLSPNMPFVSFKVENIVNVDGEKQTSAPHPQQHLYINCPYDLNPGDILRVERGG